MRQPAWWLDLLVAIVLIPASGLFILWHGAHVLFSGEDFGNVGRRTAVAARRAAWISASAAVVAGGGLMALRLWVAGSVHLLLLGAATVLFAGVATQKH
ncbi:hypothetical protein E4K10_01185 [Streptomyces sp. T1317-0309]|nr:hypothetical protein E4K10_01185 [Streptomyces sp. T1317-0309]